MQLAELHFVFVRANSCSSMLISSQDDSGWKSASSLVQVALPLRERIETFQQQPPVVTLRHLVHASISSAVSLSLRVVVQTRAEHTGGTMKCLERLQLAKGHTRRTSMARCLHEGFKDFPAAVRVHVCCASCSPAAAP